MLVKLIKTFFLMTGISVGMVFVLAVIDYLLRIIFGVDKPPNEDLPYGLEQAFDKLSIILLSAIAIFGCVAMSLSVTWLVHYALCGIWSS